MQGTRQGDTVYYLLIHDMDVDTVNGISDVVL